MNKPRYPESQESIDELDKLLESASKHVDIDISEIMLSEPVTSPEIISKKKKPTHIKWLYLYVIVLFITIGLFEIIVNDDGYIYVEPTLTDRLIIHAPMLLYGFIIAFSIYLYEELSARFNNKWLINTLSFLVFFALSNYAASLNDSTISKLKTIERAEYLEENAKVMLSRP